MNGDLPSGTHTKKILKMAIDLPSSKMVIFHNYVRLPEGIYIIINNSID